MLPNVLQPSATDHVPVLADEVRELLAVEPGRDGRRRHLRRGRPRGAARRRPARPRAAYRDRPRPDRARRTSSASARHAGVQARLLRGDFSVVLDQLADNGVQADAILLDLGVSTHAARPARAWLLLCDRRAARHAHGSVRGLSAARARQRGGRARARRRSSAATARSATRTRSPVRSGAAARSSRSSAPASSSTRSSAAIPAPARFGDGHPPSASSRLCGSPSTTSSARSRRRCRPRSRCCARAAGSPSSASTRSRTGS